ncbi:PhzF family phenazine biosynthesis protein [Bradyrhizobium sp. KB893862 SZCCT0404]|uniref:PhzF family phenazine biosynthesis protein n=1 Tax=Bradyrhizobium sp. KB893862 SZCCT0404 TaxID=2807672 RepID=UPI001BAD4647|nr:PhzF family phenazine biosynthesis protein [Bradyrhizobium sp. KB893862 SZCCT0404]MBR1175224.1 PhzF family phenazine biosynthesis protein [Bradyrhizobium sp. KB893862 SZCCT0404]
MSAEQFDYVTMSVFSRLPGGGNPAGVCSLGQWPLDATMGKLASAIALPVTSFVVEESGGIGLRWFSRSGTAVASMCGHGTLAAAKFVGDRHPEWMSFVFNTSGGSVLVEREESNFAATLPRWESTTTEIPPGLSEALGAIPVEVLDAGRDLIAVYRHDSEVRNLVPDMGALRAFGRRGIIATAPGRDYDCVSRFFCPTFGIGVDEDPVTGSAHCSIAPLWADRLQKTRLRAYQASERGGELVCDVSSTGVRISASVAVAGAGSLVFEGGIF